ncbi:MAG TPA: acyl carrier protein [Myxococcales bacterium]|jgi:acyl carrier protein|nr:acyl carrier protein [Myxococcales bacterium]
MSNEAVFEKVSQLMADLFDLDKSKITLESKFEDLDLSSLDAIDLVVELQQFTGKKVDEEGLKKVRTVGDIVALVEAHVQQDGTKAA